MKKKKKSKVKKEKSPSRSSAMRRVVRVKATDIRLGQWLATLQFAGWRQALRLAVAGSCYEPDMSKKLIFAIEDKASDIDAFKSDPNDLLRAWTASSPTPWPVSPSVSLLAGSLSRLNGRHCRPTSCRAVRRCG